MIRYGIFFTMALMAGCGASQTTAGSGSGGGSGYVECGTVQCGKPAVCVAVVGMSPEQTQQECVLKCKDDPDCPKGQTCQNVHDIGLICQMASNE
jgi:hypothetical protein